MRKALIRGGKTVAAIAAAWSLAASIYIFFAPVSRHGVTGRFSHDAGMVVEHANMNQSWYEAQGLWGTSWLVLFSLLYLLAARTAWRGNYNALAAVTLAAGTLSIVAGFSIGSAYLPAALGLLIATLMLLSSRWLQKR